MAAQVYIQLVEGGDAGAIVAVRTLLEEYLSWLGPLVCSSTLPGEIASLPQPYARPGGALLLASDDSGQAVGCVGIRDHDGESCEVKRLYVHRGLRRQGIGRALLHAAIDQARAMGYRRMLLTTLPDEMPGVVSLYRSFGFEDAEAFRHHGGQAADGVQLAFMSREL